VVAVTSLVPRLSPRLNEN